MADFPQQLAGRFVVFDGPDGSGKSTQFARFSAMCCEAGLELCEVREPGGTAIGEQIRKVLLDPENTEMSLRCEMMLYMASRSQLIEQVINPAREKGALVLADRFISSTLAYQGTAGGMSVQEIMQVGRVAIDEHWPDVTVIFDVDEKTAAQRMSGKAAAKSKSKNSGAVQHSLFDDRIERREPEFHRRVRQGYLDQAEADPEHSILIDASANEDAVFAELCEKLEAFFQ